LRKTEKPIHTMRFAIAVLNIPMNMTVLTNVSVVSNTKDGSDITKRKRENGNISARIARRKQKKKEYKRKINNK